MGEKDYGRYVDKGLLDVQQARRVSFPARIMNIGGLGDCRLASKRSFRTPWPFGAYWLDDRCTIEAANDTDGGGLLLVRHSTKRLTVQEDRLATSPNR